MVLILHNRQRLDGEVREIGGRIRVIRVVVRKVCGAEQKVITIWGNQGQK